MSESFVGMEESLGMKLRDSQLKRVQGFYLAGDYQKVCDFVDGLYGWEPGELERTSYTKESAEWVMNEVGIPLVVDETSITEKERV